MADNSTYEQLTDEALIRLLVQDDAQAFTVLYSRHWESLFLLAAKVLRSGDDALDIVQDVFHSIWRRRHKLQITGSPGAYLRTSIKFAAINFIGKNITRRDYLTVVTTMENARKTEDPEAVVQLKEIRGIVDRIVEGMPPKMKAVYLLSRDEQLSHKEIAARLNISPETVKKHVQHALQLIRTAIGIRPLSLVVVLILLLFKK